jgi:long-chain acyl-CoA synthetase
VLGVLPLYHINAFAVTMLAPLASGGSVAMAAALLGRALLGAGGVSGCTWINVVPTIISFLLEGPVPARSPRGCASAARPAALPPEHLRGFERSSASA